MAASWLLFLLALAVSVLQLVSAQCPDGCLCMLHTQMYCIEAGLQSLPERFPPTLQHLSLPKNHIQHLPADGFRELRHLKKLNLDENLITDIAPYAFRGLRGLDEISIQNNPLSILASYSFANLSDIGRLDLGYNNIVSIAPNVFTGCNNVREVFLLGNPIHLIHGGAFAGMSNVRVFYFPPGIQEIKGDSFHGLKNVTMMSLTGLHLTDLPEYSFRGLYGVGDLEIKDSRLGIVKPKAFHGLSNVEYFNIQGNSIEGLSRDAFDGMSSVGSLRLAHNRIYDVEQNAMDPLRTEVQRVNLTDNSFPCDCRLLRIVRPLAALMGSAAAIQEWNYCTTPTELIDRPATSVDVSLLGECPTPTPEALEDPWNHAIHDRTFPELQINPTQKIYRQFNSGPSTQQSLCLISLLEFLIYFII